MEMGAVTLRNLVAAFRNSIALQTGALLPVTLAPSLIQRAPSLKPIGNVLLENRFHRAVIGAGWQVGDHRKRKPQQFAVSIDPIGSFATVAARPMTPLHGGT